MKAEDEQTLKLEIHTRISGDCCAFCTHLVFLLCVLFPLLSSNIQLAEECLVRAADLPGLLLLYTSTGHAMGLERLAELAKAKGKLNIAFICFFLRGQTSKCLQLLLDAERSPEAAFLCRTYLPSKMTEVVGVWKEKLKAVNPKAADSIADPIDYPNLFDNLDTALKAEEWLKGHVLQEAPASKTL